MKFGGFVQNSMHIDMKSTKKFKKVFWAPLGLFAKRIVFLEILKLKSPYKIASSLSNAITFLKKM